MRTNLALVLTASLMASLVGCSGPSVSEEKLAIAKVVQTTTGHADARVEPIIVRTQYGIAGWTQGTAGGRTLLRKERGEWRVIANAGDEMHDPAFLEKAGVPQAEAKALVNLLVVSERSVPEARLAMLDSYAPR